MYAAPSPASSRARSVLRTSSSNLLSLLPPADHPVPLRVAAPAGGRTPEAGAVTAWRDRELPPARPRPPPPFDRVARAPLYSGPTFPVPFDIRPRRRRGAG